MESILLSLQSFELLFSIVVFGYLLEGELLLVYAYSIHIKFWGSKVKLLELLALGDFVFQFESRIELWSIKSWTEFS